MINLVLSDQEVSVVMEGLSAMPLHKAFDTFINVRQQVIQQRQPSPGPQPGQPAPPAPPADTSGGQPNGNLPN